MSRKPKTAWTQRHWIRSKRIVMPAVIGGWIALLSVAGPGTSAAITPADQSLTQLNQLPGEDQSRVAEVNVEGTVWWSNQLPGGKQSRVAAVDIEGTVWWSSETEGRIILKDDTAVVQLELDFPCQMPGLGDRLVLKGDCTAIKTTDVIKLSGVPVVDNDGLHPPEEKSGTIFLKAGRHPFWIQWFNRTDRHGLNVEYEGPGLSRQRIPNDVLFRLQADPVTGATDFVNGLDYRCYEGEWWRFLPNFDHMAAVKSGIVDNFDIGVRTRNNHVGLQFSGFIDVPNDGEYTFHVLSDDGSRLFVGGSSLQVHISGTAALPSPLPAGTKEMSSDGPEYQWSVIEGAVTSFHHEPGSLEMDLMTELGVVRLKVAEDSDCSYTLRPQNRIRGVGVSRRIHKLDGRWTLGEFFVQHWEDIEQHHISPKIWTEYSPVDISSLFRMAPSEAVGSVVHIKGNLLPSEAAQGVLLEDETGRIVLEDIHPDERMHGIADVLGLVTLDDTNRTLRCVHFRPLGEDGSDSGSLPVLTTAEQVCQLSFEEAARGYPVSVQGVIISILDYNGAVLHDSSRGIYILAGSPIPLQVGDYCLVEGVTGPFGFDPYIQVTGFQQLGKGILPTPIQPTRDQLINGTLHCNFVELEGVLASIEGDTIVLLMRDGRINVRLNPIGAEIPPESIGATVRLRGCLLNDWDGESRRLVVGSMSLDQQRVTVVHPAPVDPFDIPLKHVGDLLQFDPQAGALQRVKVSGQLVYKDRQTSYLMDGEQGLRLFPAEGTAPVRVGDRVDVVGFVDLNGPSPLLRDALIRRLGPSGLPSPRMLAADALLRDEYDSTLVQVRGVLLGISTRLDGAVLEMQSGHRRFLAIVNEQNGFEESLKPGSQLELTGVYVGVGGNRVLGRPIDSFQLLISSDRDVLVLSRPPWWTLRRLLLVVGLLIGGLLAALVWINQLHRKVDQRTAQLGEQIRRRQRIEQQHEIEQERARLAGNLHDDLGAGLTEVNMLTTLIKSKATSEEEKTQYANKLNQLALTMVTSLDEIVWAQNPRNDTLTSLAGYFSAYAQRLLELASVGCGLDVEEDIPDIPLDPKFRQELFLAFKEALTNVVKHAVATKVWLRIEVRNKTLVVRVSDDGIGMLPDRHEVGEDGLANMQARLKSLGGHCEIQSHPGEGTTVCFEAPIGKETT